jgi:CubicO group peptidase (beta-lactamase class C family)
MVPTTLLDDRLSAWVQGTPEVGLAVALVQGEDLVFARGFGVTSVEDGGPPVTPQTLFRIASTTKVLTGLALMRLVEAGLLALDTPISTYLPWLHLGQAGSETRITLRHLLSHTSGLCTFRHDYTSREPTGLERFVRDYLPAYPLLLPPGIAWLYSNAGFSLAGYLAQVVSGTPYWDLMQQWVFTPLAMARTTFDPLVALTYPCAHAYSDRADGLPQVDHAYVQNTAWDPAGGAVSTVLDLAQVALMFLHQGRFQDRAIVRPETILRMHTPVVRLWTAREEAYGLGWAMETYKGLRLLRHNGGGIGSYRCYFYLIPQHEFAFILLANGPPPPNLLQEVLDQLFELPTIVPTPPILPADRAVWERYTGAYIGIYTGLVEVRVEGEHLYLRRNGKDVRLEQRDREQANHYIGATQDGDQTLSVGFLAEEPNQGASVLGVGKTRYLVVDDAPCGRVPFLPEVVPEPVLWSEWTGTYLLPGGSAMPNPALTVTLEAGTVMLTRGQSKMPCIPVSPSEFACDEGLLAFRPTDDGPCLEMWRTMTAKRISAA